MATGALSLISQAVPGAQAGSDPLGVRGDFPITGKRIHLNAAYTAAIPNAVVAAATAFAEGKALQPATVGDMLKVTEKVRAQYARLIGGSSEEIAFVASTSEGENLVANAIAWQAGDNVVTDDLHYESGFVIFRHLAQTRGVELRVVKNQGGAVTAADYARVVDKRTRLLTLSYVSSLNGYRHDLKAMATLAHQFGAWLYVDGIQGVGAFPLDVHDTGIDFMCSGTYKWLLSTYGIAPFYIRKDLIEKLPLDRYGWKHAKELPDGNFEISHTASRFEYATLPFSEVYQLGAALDYLERVGVDRIGTHVLALAQRIREGLSAQGKRLFTPMNNASPTVTFYFDGDPAPVHAAFNSAQIDVTIRDKEKQIRVSPALYNNLEDVTHFLEVVRKL
ncbi:MAG: aminotransferase class V-fold PLP-dependent enzyme [Cyclobacteriaceae bacterium]|nr:aminotransferase class V-fold PLP-dependent enzyme [Cyclobacteriaceae bacterium]